MEARNNQNTRLAKKKGSCRILIVRWADCLGTNFHRNGIRTDPYCMPCSLRKPMDRNHLGQCTALFNMTECERYWEARTKMMENLLCFISITIFVTTPYYEDFHIYLKCCL